jgi:putative RNA 2'-phosphotransferase
MRKELVKTSKFLSLVLRHKPEKIGLQLDPNGWADVDELLKKSDLSKEVLDEVVETNEKKRFKYSEDGKRIRASQGHSLKNVDLNIKSQIPPPILYHGTAHKNVESIKNKGLLKGNRQHVHLSKDVYAALDVGKRHGKPFCVTIDTKSMVEQGYKFFLSDNDVWLTDHVPAKYLGYLYKD